ncbi:DExH-box ATP-dependent RNA helicase DExH13 [Lathyrus oleraceus]|uniref:DExH-box ATP-dependent RNA helicase DExH13 n=1 Tax=Pisum sativum TaxID=3888 RepID=A0A9D4VY77_PEA|nr:DExH-box ATP-dependent RNA helicase DExH13 [Pisum sativum]
MLKVTLREGVGYLHEGLNNLDHDIVAQLFEAGWIQVCVLSSSMCYKVTLSAHLVVVMGTQYYHGRENAQIDYPVTDILQMMGLASRHLVDNSGKCVIFCRAPRKEYYKKFLYEEFRVESHLRHFLHHNLNAENKQDAVDYRTWTFMYRRLTKNPNYYNLQGVSHGHLSEYLSEMVENTLSDLETSKCVAIEDDIHLSPLNLGSISSYYHIRYTIIERFSLSITSNTKMKGLLEVLSSALEYAYLPIRLGEEEAVRKLVNHQRKCKENPGKSIETIFDLLEMEDIKRRELLSMSDSQLLDIARFCNHFPNIDLSYEVLHNDTVQIEEDITVYVTLERDLEGRIEVGPVHSPRYPKAKEEG